jgi:hypothetical protein
MDYLRAKEPQSYKTPLTLESGVKNVKFTASSDKLQGISIAQNEPLPMCVTAIIPTIDMGE